MALLLLTCKGAHSVLFLTHKKAKKKPGGSGKQTAELVKDELFPREKESSSTNRPSTPENRQPPKKKEPSRKPRQEEKKNALEYNIAENIIWEPI